MPKLEKNKDGLVDCPECLENSYVNNEDCETCGGSGFRDLKTDLFQSQFSVEQLEQEVRAAETLGELHMKNAEKWFNRYSELENKLTAAEAKTQELQTELLASKDELIVLNKAIEAQESWNEELQRLCAEKDAEIMRIKEKLLTFEGMTFSDHKPK